MKAKQIAFHNRPGVHRHRLHSIEHRTVPDDLERSVRIPAVPTTLQRHALAIRLARVDENDAITLARHIQCSSQRAEWARFIADNHGGTAVTTVVADLVVDMDLACFARKHPGCDHRYGPNPNPHEFATPGKAHRTRPSMRKRQYVTGRKSARDGGLCPNSQFTSSRSSRKEGEFREIR